MKATDPSSFSFPRGHRNQRRWDHVDYYPNFNSVLEAYEGSSATGNLKDGHRLRKDRELATLLSQQDQREAPDLWLGRRWTGAPKTSRHNRGGLPTPCPGRHADTEISPDLRRTQRPQFARRLRRERDRVPLEVASQALKSFKGAKRRLQHMGSVPALGVDIFDDYGHHPREIAATLGTLRKMFPERRLMTVFQPHRFTRTAAMYREFAEVLSMSDRVFLLPVFPADESPIEGVSSTLMGSYPEAKRT